MMKILLLNSKFNAKQELVKNLLARDISVLICDQTEDALKIIEFQGDSIDIVVVHREGTTARLDSGLKFIEKLKVKPKAPSLPVILTSETWGDLEFAQHQSGPFGVQGYLRFPFTEDQLLHLFEAVLGFKVKEIRSRSILSPAIAETSDQTVGSVDSMESLSTPTLENAAEVFQKPEISRSTMSIQIQLQDFDVDSPGEGNESSQLGQSSPTSSSGEFQSSGLHSIEVAELKPVEITPEFEAAPVEENSPELSSEPDSLASFELTGLSDPKIPTEIREPTRVDAQVAEEMPYLNPDFSKKNPLEFDASLAFTSPLGDAVVPGGVAQTPDIDTFKKYLMLREQDVAILSTQLKIAQEQLAVAEQLLKDEKIKHAELNYLANEQKNKIEEFEKEKAGSVEQLRKEVDELNFQLKVKTDKSRVLERQLRETVDSMEQLKARIRTDIRKIRVREKELENRLEMGKKDSEALIAARENKIIELKRKLDVVEFNMDLLQDQYSKEKEVSTALRERLARASQVVRVVSGLLEADQGGAGSIAQILDTPESKELEHEDT